VLAPADARLAVKYGADGIIVSNHGGRQLDYSPAALDVLPAVVAAVDGRVPVMMDGGVRRGTDVLKALALGASAVLLGRPVLYGLAVGGPTGVTQVSRCGCSLVLNRDKFKRSICDYCQPRMTSHVLVWSSLLVFLHLGACNRCWKPSGRSLSLQWHCLAASQLQILVLICCCSYQGPSCNPWQPWSWPMHSQTGCCGSSRSGNQTSAAADICCECTNKQGQWQQQHQQGQLSKL